MTNGTVHDELGGQLRTTIGLVGGYLARATAFGCLLSVTDGNVDVARSEAVTLIGLIALACFASRGQWLAGAIPAVLGTGLYLVPDGTSLVDPDDRTVIVFTIGTLALLGAWAVESVFIRRESVAPARVAVVATGGGCVLLLAIASVARTLDERPGDLATGPAVALAVGLLVPFAALLAACPWPVWLRRVLPERAGARLVTWHGRALATDDDRVCVLSEAAPTILVGAVAAVVVADAITGDGSAETGAMVGGGVLGLAFWAGLIVVLGGPSVSPVWTVRMKAPASVLLQVTLGVGVVWLAVAGDPGALILLMLAVGVWFGFGGRSGCRWLHDALRRRRREMIAT
ncbi:hypothetical protein AB0L40_02410 [Patulibacter sp. NPDC049589]|uniref:hypothetical protein n=1 Tax=Patulibacter sp. NPDC049589 TaxID=3154731 RepID=UPI00343CC52B